LDLRAACQGYASPLRHMLIPDNGGIKLTGLQGAPKFRTDS
jgi:hypothetical protein